MPKKRHGHRFLAAIKGVTKGGVETLLGTDKVKASAGSEHAKNRLGVVKSDAETLSAGPVQFPARYKGQKGHAYITTTATTPALSWTTKKEDIDPVWSISIEDIAEVKKVGGLGWKSKVIVGWATDWEVQDGIIVVERGGVKRQLTAVTMREELFNRLVSLGKQMWEAW